MTDAWDIALLSLGGLSLLGILVTYALYPACMGALARFRPRPWHTDDRTLPPVTMVVTAYNEEDVIEAKLRNFLAMEYPGDRLFLLIASDGSTDRTDRIIAEFADGVRVRFFPLARGGKMRAVNSLMRHVQTPLVVFSDANTMYQPDALRRLVRHFADPAIGGVCGNLRLNAASSSVGAAGEKTYWAYENVLKRWEGGSVTTLGATGGIYAIRTAAYVPHPEISQVADDLLLPMHVVAQGLRFVYDASALAHEDTMPSVRYEFRRKIRVAWGSILTLQRIRGFAARLPRAVRVMFFCHKTLRWLGPFFLLGLLGAAAGLARHELVRDALLLPGLLLALLIAAGWLAELRGSRLGPFSLPFYFLASNLALLVAWWRFATSEAVGTWEKQPRGS